MFAAANAFALKRPVCTSAAITSFKAWSADLMMQKLVEKRETVDVRRSLLFASFGLLYQGGVQYWMYNVLFERVLFPGRGLRNTVAKIAASNLVADPVFFFPVFYSMREVMMSHKSFDVAVPAALQKYKENCVTDWFNSWAIWVPAHSVTYTIVPPHLRMPWIAAVSFGYVCILSFTRGADGKEKETFGLKQEQLCHGSQLTV